MGDIGGVAQAGASIAGAGIQAGATMSAAGTAADAAKYGAGLQSQAAANSLDYQKNVFNTQQKQQAPYIAAGQGAINSLAAGAAPGGSLNQNWTQQFNAPAPFSFSGVNETNNPAYQFNLQQGEQAVQRSAAAQGGLVSGGAMKSLNDYAQGQALNAYGTDYATAANTYNTNYANALGQYQQAYNIFNQNQTNSFNKQAAVAGIGQTAVGQIGQAGSQSAAQVANTSLTGANNAANYLTQGANASAAGALQLGNAITGGVNGVANAFANNYTPAQAAQQSSASSYGSGDYNGDGGGYLI
jgi:hypothetical protein